MNGSAGCPLLPLSLPFYRTAGDEMAGLTTVKAEISPTSPLSLLWR